MMFIIGKKYTVKLDEGSGVIELFNCKVVKVDGAVVKFQTMAGEIIVNTNSPRFVMAEPV